MINEESAKAYALKIKYLVIKSNSEINLFKSEHESYVFILSLILSRHKLPKLPS